ncbi:tryptophan halogenase family protein [Parasphingorhabdus sp.]|uniref:tryptophan halogenase family protein n=1 Tax=Parasphingorhabdus sp. TaxID=2709688 RepID=UPI003D2823DD
MTVSSIQHVVIVGGGTAGWLSACLLAAKLPSLSITLVEAPDIPTIGVGEGSWPTLRETLSDIGISEAEFLLECDASFKQGSRFDGWVDGSEEDSYLHPFTAPPPEDMRGFLSAWQEKDGDNCFAAAMTPQAQVCKNHLAPRQKSMPDYAGALNYGYHLDAGKFVTLLTKHGMEHLDVVRVADQVTDVTIGSNGDIEALQLRDNPALTGDFFLDCTGHAAALIGRLCENNWIDRSDVSFNDRALAVQLPVSSNSAIASQTIGTAHEAGWLWDIALPTRRGIGCVYSSRFMDDEQAEQVLKGYLGQQFPDANLAEVSPRKLSFSTGHREKFWVRNCVSIGLSAGFIEPLEASAIVLIELSLKALADNFPASCATMDIHAARFNDLFRYKWDRIVDFLKLHYVLSNRMEPYWQAHRAPETIPARLSEQLSLWREQPPSTWDFPQVDEIFSAPSQQYVLYGMGFPLPMATHEDTDEASVSLLEINKRARTLAAALPSNRDYLAAIAAKEA